MLLTLHPFLLSPPPKTLNPITFSPLFPIPNTLIPQNPKFRIRSSICDPKTTLPQSAIERIADKLRSLGFTEPKNDDDNNNKNSNSSSKTHISKSQLDTKSAGEIFIPLPNQLTKYRVGHTLDPSWSTPENPVPRPGAGNAISRYHELREDVKRERLEKKREQKGQRVPSLAELSLSRAELRRLTTIGIKERRKLKVGKAGITEGIVNGIHERWRRHEVVKIACEDLCRMNMKRTHDLLERKTGGMVVWRSGSKIVLYRGVNYKYPYFLLDNNSVNETSIVVQNTNVDVGADKMQNHSSKIDGVKSYEELGPTQTNKIVKPALIQGVGTPNRVRFQLPSEAQLTEEVDRWLDRLGPRFSDWWGVEPLPVDADLLPAVVPGCRRPFRLLPYGIKPKLTNDEMTTLKRLGRPLPCHFALGRNRKLQGLAAAILKLWERCEIAKIAVKRGVQNTNSELMAEELKGLTGGILLSRDREFIVLYRGKDFLPSAVSSAVEKRRKHEIRRDKQQTSCNTVVETREEHKDRTMNYVSTDEHDGTNYQHNFSEQRKLSSTAAAFKRTSIKLAMVLEKKVKADKLLADLKEAEAPQQLELDKEGITQEERYMLRKVGLQMKPFLLLGRRGVFAGTVENMHLHWKYRELVKLICKERSFETVNQVAQTLEAESGGILVAVDRVSKGYAIIMYRGKNYRRPSCLRPSTLLTKREALKLSLEAQRRKSLKLHILKLTRNINDLKIKLDGDKETHNMQSVDESRIYIKEETNSMEAATCGSSGSDLNSHYVIPAHCEGNGEIREKHGVASNPVNLNNDLDLDASRGNVRLVAQEVNETGESKSEFTFKSLNKEISDSQFSSLNSEDVESTSCPDNRTEFQSERRSFSPLVRAEDGASGHEVMDSVVESEKNELKESVLIMEEKNKKMQSRVVQLSNKDRLLLRKQALKMKKRPVLAVGRSNVVTGVAKAIKAHFQKHPLAIVSIKDRAKGTSVQEVVFELLQETGAVLVSHEPTKVILYRGWGPNDKPGKKNAQNAEKSSIESTRRSQPAVSSELIAAIRLECGLQHNKEEKPTPSAEI